MRTNGFGLIAQGRRPFVMDENKKKKRIKGWIIALSILLGISVVALCLLFAYKKNLSDMGGVSGDISTDNIITPDKDEKNNKGVPEAETETESLPYDLLKLSTVQGGQSTYFEEQTVMPDREPEGSISLYQGKPSDNKEIHFKNMFPGDSVKGTYAVKVTYEDTAQVHFEIEYLGGDAILAKGLCVKILETDDGELLYDGSVADLPSDLQTALVSKGKTSTVLNYEITTYLPTSAGNEYMNKQVKLAYKWWAEGHLLPITGDRNNMTLWIIIAAAAVVVIAVLIIVLVKKRKGDDHGKKE